MDLLVNNLLEIFSEKPSRWSGNSMEGATFSDDCIKMTFRFRPLWVILIRLAVFEKSSNEVTSLQ